VAAPRAPETRRAGEHLLYILRLDAVPEGEVQHVSVIPLESRDPHPGPRRR
jgi:hypothetical protein